MDSGIGSSSMNSLLRPRVFDGSHFDFWSERLKSCMECHEMGLWNYITNGYDFPVNPTTGERLHLSEYNEAQQRACKRENRAKFILINAITCDDFMSLPRTETAKEIYDSLKPIYLDKRREQILESYENFVMSTNESIEHAHARFQRLMCEMEEVDLEFNLEKHLRKFLTSLSFEWIPVINGFLRTVDLSFSFVFRYLHSLRLGYGVGEQRGPPVLLLHGLFMAGDAWFLNTPEQSLGFILADQGFDVWVGNVRGTRWSHGHISLPEKNKHFWDWSFQELALYDLAEMINYIYSVTNSKLFVVGHSQGTIISFAAFTQPEIVEKVEAAALLSPISYLDHVSAPLVLRMVKMHLDQMVVTMGVHKLNFKSDWGASLLVSLCDTRLSCSDMLSSITGKNCCFNESRVAFYLEQEPHPSSSKNLNHLFQMIRKGTFSKYDYGKLRNLKEYGKFKPPKFDLSRIPKSLPLWMAYGGNDALADIDDFQHTLKELPSTPEVVYLENYGHVDFILSLQAKQDLYDPMISFFKSFGKFSSSI